MSALSKWRGRSLFLGTSATLCNEWGDRLMNLVILVRFLCNLSVGTGFLIKSKGFRKDEKSQHIKGRFEVISEADVWKRFQSWSGFFSFEDRVIIAPNNNILRNISKPTFAHKSFKDMKFSTILSIGLIPSVALGAFSNVTYSSSASKNITSSTTQSGSASTPIVPSSSTPIVPSSIYPNGTTAYTTKTEVVTEYTTYCPYPTTIVTNGGTYIVTSATTLTITNCPCTLTHTIPEYSSSASYAESSAVVTSGSSSVLVTSSAPAETTTSSVVIAPNGAGNLIVPPFLGAAGIAVLLL